ncbi:MAG: SGNH/GDSL hydrolase family protein [Phycisphaerales bacterium]|nr:MAG: SGNH/GDSL hydrolase family protein [Phycisphaerales bacterium]
MGSGIELRASHKIVFIGDSITDADRDLPAYRPFGFGYVHFVANHLLAKYPELDISIVNAGVSGNTVRDLSDRWQKDCIAHDPDLLSVLVGVNDLWRQFAEPEGLPGAVSPDEYRSTYTRLLVDVKQQCDCRIVLGEPFMFCSNPRDEMFQALESYIRVVHDLADRFDGLVIPLQRRIDELIEKVPPGKWSLDSVHPYVWAHAWIAQRWLEVTGL